MKSKASDQGNTALFYSAVKMFKEPEQPKKWDVRVLFPNEPDQFISEEVANFFNQISHEFSPISDGHFDIGEEWNIDIHVVAYALKNSKSQNPELGEISFQI